MDLAQAYSFDPLYSSGNYGSGTTVALVEMSGAGYSPTDIGQFAACYGITLGNQQVTQRTVAGGGATGGGTVEAELDIETVLSLAPKANIEVYEGGPTADMYSVFNSIVSDDTAKIVSASWTNGCEAYVAQAYQNSENTLFQTAAIEGQSIFVASGDQGAEGCNFNGVVTAPTKTQPGAQVIDPSTGTLYIANKSSGNVTVDSEGSSGNPSSAVNAASVPTGSSPDAVALDTSDGKVFVANAGSSSLTAFSTGTCNQAATSGCASPTQIASSGGDLTAPTALAVNGSTLYVANSNGTVAVFNAKHERVRDLRHSSPLEFAHGARRRQLRRCRVRRRRRVCERRRLLQHLHLQRDRHDVVCRHAGHGPAVVSTRSAWWSTMPPEVSMSPTRGRPGSPW